MENDRRPAEAVHAAEYVEDAMRERGWTLDELAAQVPETFASFGMRHAAIEMYLTLRTPEIIIGELADWFAAAFGTSAQLWRNLDDAWRAHTIGADTREVR